MSDNYENMQFDTDGEVIEYMGDDFKPITQPVLPEAPFSANWKMYRSMESHQFTVRTLTVDQLLDNMDELTTKAQARGWGFANDRTQVALPVQQPVPPVGQQVQAARPISPATQGGATKMETFEGYVIGNSHSKQTNKYEPCVHLYIAPLEFRMFTIYPERTDLMSMLPTGVPTQWEMPGAPPKAQAKVQGYYHTHPMTIKVYADLDANGVQNMRTTKDGKQYPVWRLPTREEFAADSGYPPVVGAQPVQSTRQAPPAPALPTRQIPVTKNIAPASDPSTQALTPQSLNWTMAGNAETVADFAIPAPLDAWAIEQREKVSHVIDDPAADRATPKQWELMNDWMYNNVTHDTLGTQAFAMQLNGIGAVPLAGLLTGVFIDRFAMDPSDIPAAVAVYFLQRIKDERQPGVPNPMYDANFAENTAAVMRQAIATLSADQEGGW